jgi:hypothetical protein
VCATCISETVSVYNYTASTNIITFVFIPELSVQNPIILFGRPCSVLKNVSPSNRRKLLSSIDNIYYISVNTPIFPAGGAAV